MRILLCGADGYLGWPTAMHFSAQGHEVLAVDNYLRRDIARNTSSTPLFETPNLPDRAELFKATTGKSIDVKIGDLADYRFTERLFKDFAPETVIHYAEQPSAPYSMAGFEEARLTLRNNLDVTFNLIWGMIEHAPKSHMVKIGTMGEYGTPNIDIEEGWINIKHNGREDKFLYPRQAGSFYHTTKILDTDMAWFYVRMHGLKITDLMQGPVYGLITAQTEIDPNLRPFFNYDDMFGTVVNRFLVQAVAGVPLTVYGKGGQTRGYLDLRDTIQCVDLATHSPPAEPDLRIYNQFVETFSVNELADKISQVGKGLGIDVKVNNLPNPRQEAEDHYYNPKHSGLLELGLKPHYMTDDVLGQMMEAVLVYRDKIDQRMIMPRVSWNK